MDGWIGAGEGGRERERADGGSRSTAHYARPGWTGGRPAAFLRKSGRRDSDEQNEEEDEPRRLPGFAKFRLIIKSLCIHKDRIDGKSSTHSTFSYNQNVTQI